MSSLGYELPQGLWAMVDAAYGLPLSSSKKLIDMGDECDIWRVATARATVAVRLSPAARSEVGLEWAHRLLTYVASRVPEALVPLITTDGKTTLRWEGRLVSVYPWVDGEPATIEMPFLCEAAARLLARLHRAMLGWTEPSPTLTRRGGQQTELADAELDREVAEIERSPGLVRGAIHGDYYPRNLICRRERIVAVIDWDESHDDLLAQELAWAVWEFAQERSDPNLDMERARNFLAAYADESGPVPASELRLMVPLIRKRLREEVDQAAAWAARGAVIDHEYMDREIAAFHKLREVDIEW